MPEPVFPESPAFFRGTFHARARFPGRFCNFPGDLPCQEPFSRKVLRFSGDLPCWRLFSRKVLRFSGDLPCWRLFSRKVLRFSGGPSMPGAIFLEGPAFFRGTFHARGHFPGRFWCFQWDLPCQIPFSWKVLPFSGGPSMPGAIFLEGPCPSALSLRYFGTPGAVMPLIQEMQRRSRSA